MKSDINRGRFYVECDCKSNDHILVFESYDYLPDENYPDDKVSFNVDVFFSGNYRAPWYKRIWYALQFVFNNKKFCWGDSVGISKTNVQQLEEIVDYFKGTRKEQREAEILELRKEMKDIDENLFANNGGDFNFEDSYILGTIRDLIQEIKDLKQKLVDAKKLQ